MQRPRYAPMGSGVCRLLIFPQSPSFFHVFGGPSNTDGTDSPDHTGQRPEIQVMASVPVLKGGTVQTPLYLIERKTVHKTDDDAAMGNSDGFAQYVFRVVHVFQHGEQSCVIEFFIVEREMFRAAQLEFSPVPQPFPRHVEQVSTGIKPRDIKSIVPEHPAPHPMSRSVCPRRGH